MWNSKLYIGLLSLYFCILLPSICSAAQCPHPAVPINTKVTVSGDRKAGDSAKYSCDDGYTLFGSQSLTCSSEGKWIGELPVCATNVAWQRPANQSSTARGGEAENANDGERTTVHDGKMCTESNSDTSPWWGVDLLQPYTVSIVRITTRQCCDVDPLQDIEIRVGDSTNIQSNRLCSWFPGTIDAGTTKELRCARPVKGRYVYVQMVGVKGKMSLCEVEVFSTEDFSKDRCTKKTKLDQLGLFNQTCYEFQVTEGGTFASAREYCQERNGDLISKVSKISHSYISSELDRRLSAMETKLVWIGARREEAFVSRKWKWVDGRVVEKPQWGRDQPNNYNGKQDCIVLDGAREWLWNDVGCDLNYLHWICQYSPATCGSPDVKENTTINSGDFSSGSTITYLCPEGSRVVGNGSRSCLKTGYWTGEAPVCKYVDCGTISDIEHGKVILADNRTTWGAESVFECFENYTLVGPVSRKCADGDTWSGVQPKCMYSWCPELSAPENGQIALSGRRAGDSATFSCERGYNLVGKKDVNCTLGGSWSAKTPLCHFIDCGVPEDIEDGQMTLVNGTTFLNSLARYECGDDFWIEGLSMRQCKTDGKWEGVPPTCQMIQCDKPIVPVGGYVTGYSFDVHSEVVYHCEEGHLMEGESVRICTRAGEWSGEPPTCSYVDCGHLPPIYKGEIHYLNGTTFLGSEALYVCANNHKLIGEDHRVCLDSGLWSGDMPRCQEIRCPELEKPSKTVISVTGNHRGMRPNLRTPASRHSSLPPTNTYRVASKINYKCERGYVIKGHQIRQCQEDGTWTGTAPSCEYVDCGPPESISPGTFRLLSNDTHYGSIVSYECGENWRLRGNLRRTCLDNGTWSGEVPQCFEMQCTDLDDLTEALKVQYTRDRKIASQAIYSCEKGFFLVGSAERTCKGAGIWEGVPPRCEVVSCSQPEDIENGRVLRLNKTLVFGSLVEYHCFPKYRLSGPFTRACNANGEWSGEQPECSMDDYSTYGDNSLDGDSSTLRGATTADDSGNTGMIVGICVAILIIASVIIGLFLFRARRNKQTDNVDEVGPVPQENGPIGQRNRNGEKDWTERRDEVIMSYSDLNDPTSGSNIYENIAEDEPEYNEPEYHYADMKSNGNSNNGFMRHIYSNENNGVYANGDAPEDLPNSEMNSTRAGGHAGGLTRPRIPPPQPPNVPSSVVTINGVSVASN